MTVNWPPVAIALTGFPIVTLMLKLLGYKRLPRWLHSRSPAQENQSQSKNPRAISRTVRAVAIAASRGPIFGTCLSRSLTLQWLLRWQRIESKLCIGVRRQNRQFVAHAWLERGGVVINDRPEVKQEYAALDLRAMPSAAVWQ